MPERSVAIITGAGSGIGRAIAVALASDGWRLVLVGRTEATLEETGRTIAARVDDAGDALVIPADLSDAEQARSVVSMTMEHFGRVDALINNAAICLAAPLEESDPDRLFTTFATNVFGPMLLTAAALPHMRSQRRGRVINISSIATLSPFPGLCMYAASKSAVESLTRSIMVEAGDAGVRAFTIAPGAVETKMLRGIVSERELPPDNTLAPVDIAQIVADCVAGHRDADAGTVIVRSHAE